MSAYIAEPDPTRNTTDLLADASGAEGLVWGQDADAPVGGDTVTLGWGGLRTRHNFETEREFTHVEVPMTAWGDYHGSTLQRANFEALVEDFPDTFVVVTSGYGGHALALPLGVEIPEHLFDALVGIANEYPLYDDESHSMLEMRLQDEAWESDGAADFRRELEEWADAEHGHLFVPDDLDLHELFMEACESANFYPHCEDAVSAYLFNDLVVSEAGWLLLGQWQERAVHADQLVILI